MAEGIRPYHRGRVQAYPTADAQTFEIGRVVTLVAGEVTDADVSPVPAADIIGITVDPAEWPNAMPALTLAGGKPYDKDTQLTLVSLAGSNRTFVGTLIDAETIAVADVGTEVGIVEDADGIQRISKAEVTKVAVITELVGEVGSAATDGGTDDGKVVVRFLDAAITPYAA